MPAEFVQHYSFVVVCRYVFAVLSYGAIVAAYGFLEPPESFECVSLVLLGGGVSRVQLDGVVAADYGFFLALE
jgi:hypothetical protein